LAHAIKNNEKKGRPLKLFIHCSKLQAAISKETQHTDAGACVRLRTLHFRRFCSANWPEHALVGLGRVTAPIDCDSLCPSSSEVSACNLERWMKSFNGRPFLRCFLLRGPIRKSQTWRSAARVVEIGLGLSMSERSSN
jgi:hypothetical protein